MMTLYGYWRSSAAYRVRIALNFKGVTVTHLPVHLVNHGGEQHSDAYRALNPQALVPTLVVEDETQEKVALSQSLAIIDYLEERYPQPSLLPSSALARAQVRAMALMIACEMHPVNNLRVLQYLTQTLRLDDAAKSTWYQHWMAQGLTALEVQLSRHAGAYSFGDNVTLADVCLVPQIYNARRFNVDLSPYPTVLRVCRACEQLQAFADAAPECQADAVSLK